MTRNRMIQRAAAQISGGNVRGKVCLIQRRHGVQVTVRLAGLPRTESGFFAMHIHMGGDCDAPGTHLDLSGGEHPSHTGDLPPVMYNRGCVFQTVLTGRFRLADVVGRTVVIHAGPDDFRTQPSGNPGPVLACGVILQCQSYGKL